MSLCTVWNKLMWSSESILYTTAPNSTAPITSHTSSITTVSSLIRQIVFIWSFYISSYCTNKNVILVFFVLLKVHICYKLQRNKWFLIIYDLQAVSFCPRSQREAVKQSWWGFLNEVIKCKDWHGFTNAFRVCEREVCVRSCMPGLAEEWMINLRCFEGNLDVRLLSSLC